MRFGSMPGFTPTAPTLNLLHDRSSGRLVSIAPFPAETAIKYGIGGRETGNDRVPAKSAQNDKELQ